MWKEHLQQCSQNGRHQHSALCQQSFCFMWSLFCCCNSFLPFPNQFFSRKLFKECAPPGSQGSYLKPPAAISKTTCSQLNPIAEKAWSGQKSSCPDAALSPNEVLGCAHSEWALWCHSLSAHSGQWAAAAGLCPLSGQGGGKMIGAWVRINCIPCRSVIMLNEYGEAAIVTST